MIPSGGIEWRIYYTDGTTFDSTQGRPEDAPALRVQVVAQANNFVGRVLIHNGDYYWYHGGEWFGGDIAGAYNYLVTQGIMEPGARFNTPIDMLRWMIGTGHIKLGEMLRADKFKIIYDRAYDDPDLPRKSALHPQEKRLT